MCEEGRGVSLGAFRLRSGTTFRREVEKVLDRYSECNWQRLVRPPSVSRLENVPPISDHMQQGARNPFAVHNPCLGQSWMLVQLLSQTNDVAALDCSDNSNSTPIVHGKSEQVGDPSLLDEN